ncbi:mannose-6-phosphate isomerase [Clostridium bovifaecis]|uniref:Phosphohexomutase n=1 Tax=Clostridium bovifaecis TaxID=2184719 RepID=A0A6I6F639_9CLOT|nr:mannose-6-phosphate isomerase [Clostridium bovifaecis]
MYPLKFENLYYEKVWGGRNLEKFRDNLPEGNIGESWDVACHLNGTSVVLNGDYKGTRLDDLIKLQGEKLIGTKIYEDKFPLLIKLIDASDKLSIQVHPNDEYLRIEGEFGKTEVWYILDANEESKLILGTKSIYTKEEMKAAIENGTLEEHINEISVKKGQVYFVKSGLIHAIGRGIVIAEIQQNSDTTYRVYDYNRGRELHVNKALDVIDLSLKGEESKGLIATKEGYSKTYLCLCREFSLELYNIQNMAKEKSDKERFFIFTCVDGEGEIIYSNGIVNNINIKRGDSILIPAFLGEYTLNGKMKLLKSYVPDMQKVEEQILSEVKK